MTKGRLTDGRELVQATGQLLGGAGFKLQTMVEEGDPRTTAYLYGGLLRAKRFRGECVVEAIGRCSRCRSEMKSTLSRLRPEETTVVLGWSIDRQELCSREALKQLQGPPKPLYLGSLTSHLGVPLGGAA